MILHYRTQIRNGLICLSFDLDAEAEGSPLPLLDEPCDESEPEGELAKVASVRPMYSIVEWGVGGHFSGEDAEDVCDATGDEELFKTLGIIKVAAMKVEPA